MNEERYPSINVLNVFRGFATGKLRLKITPYRFQLPDGRSFVVKKVRQMTTQDVGGFRHYHYVLQTTDDRYFHIVFDSGKLAWKLIQEIDEELLFNE